MRITVISFRGSSVTMLHESSTLVATAGLMNWPVLQARDRDLLHQHQVKQRPDSINGYDFNIFFTDCLLS